MLSWKTFVHFSVCFIFGTCMCGLSGFSLNDPHPWGGKVFFLQIFSGCFMILSAFKDFRLIRFYEWTAALLICFLYADSMAFLNLHLLEEINVRFYSSDAGRDFMGNLLGAVFVTTTWISGNFLVGGIDEMIEMVSEE